MTYLSLILAAATLEVVAAEVGNDNKAADVTDMNAVRVTDLKETLAQKLCSTVRDLTVTLHLTETKTTVPETHQASSLHTPRSK